jgi:excisionase family DNA binding protein
MLSRQEVYITLDDAATLLGVSVRTITKMFDRGLLRGHKMPGSPIRRVYRSSAVQMARELGLDTTTETPRNS